MTAVHVPKRLQTLLHTYSHTYIHLYMYVIYVPRQTFCWSPRPFEHIGTQCFELQRLVAGDSLSSQLFKANAIQIIGASYNMPMHTYIHTHTHKYMHTHLHVYACNKDLNEKLKKKKELQEQSWLQVVGRSSLPAFNMREIMILRKFFSVCPKFCKVAQVSFALSQKIPLFIVAGTY